MWRWQMSQNEKFHMDVIFHVWVDVTLTSMILGWRGGGAEREGMPPLNEDFERFKIRLACSSKGFNWNLDICGKEVHN